MTDTILPYKQPENRAAALPAGSGFKAFITRLHFYVGLLVGPFVLVAAVTGTLYVLTPQIEDYIYRDQLRTVSSGPERSLSAQADAARNFIGEGPSLFAVRPAPAPGHTTRVMFSEPGLGSSENRAIFVDPETLDIKGDLIVYGTSGSLPLRTQLDYLHRNLLLGEFGRYYSELAASWLWIAALGGVLLWWWRSGKKGEVTRLNANLRTRRFHGQVGIWLAVGLVFLSVTGLTWSKWAGGRIDQFRTAVGWVTPSVSAALDKDAVTAGGHAAHHDHGMAAATTEGTTVDHGAQLDRIYAVSREAGIDSGMIEIRPPRAADQAWTVREYDRSWPTQVDTIAIDPRSMEVTSRADFETFPIIAKLIRWGIDLHMGILFGVPNQILMAGIGIALIVTIIYGYRIWWQRRPAPGAAPRTMIQSWVRLSLPLKSLSVLIACGLGWALPLVGGSLIVFLLVDALRWRVSSVKRKAATVNSTLR